jgi:hypothetical protein
MKGRVTFDYASANGIVTIGRGDAVFETQWSRAGGDSIHAYRDPPSIESIALASGANEINVIRDAERFDYTSRACCPKEGQVLLLKNTRGLYAAIKVRDVKSAGHGDPVDEITFDFAILEDGSRSFADISDMQVIDNSFTRRVLLTGAGFSRNWGGLLAGEVNGRLMSHAAVRARPRLQPLLLREPFEDALETTRTGLYERADEAAIETAIRAVFDEMDSDFRNPMPPVLGATINDFLARFCPGPVAISTGYVFSLNQDLLFERIYGTQVNKQQLVTPGIRWLEPRPPFPAAAHRIPLANIVDPGEDEPALLRNFNLIKLHGSINWRNKDGTSSMVMGRRKPLTISRSPLLGWYHQVFEQVLFSGGVRLMVIGYGWGDDHINEPIAEAVRNHGLQIYSWNPASPVDMLRNVARRDDILPGIFGFSTRPMSEVMPHQPMNPGTASYDAIVRDFF